MSSQFNIIVAPIFWLFVSNYNLCPIGPKYACSIDTWEGEGHSSSRVGAMCVCNLLLGLSIFKKIMTLCGGICKFGNLRVDCLNHVYKN